MRDKRTKAAFYRPDVGDMQDRSTISRYADKHFVTVDQVVEGSSPFAHP